METARGKAPIPGTGSILAMSSGVNSTKTVRLTMGRAISQLTSGARLVLGLADPKKTDR